MYARHRRLTSYLLLVVLVVFSLALMPWLPWSRAVATKMITFSEDALSADRLPGLADRSVEERVKLDATAPGLPSVGEAPAGLTPAAWQRMMAQMAREGPAQTAAALRPVVNRAYRPRLAPSMAAAESETAKLTTPTGSKPGDWFGFTVAVDGDFALVGAPNVSQGLSFNVGRAYLFARNEGGADNWGLVRGLVASDSHGDAQFGSSVALNGNTALVGAPFAYGVNSPPFPQSGAAYVFERDAGGADNWGQVKKLVASDLQVNDAFGYAVALSEDTALVGAQLEDGGAGDPKPDAGAAYLFERDAGGAGAWGQVKKLVASDAQNNDQFGYSVTVNRDTALLGAPLEDDGGGQAGAVYFFGRDAGGAGNWGQVKKRTASDAQASDQFGYSVALSGNTALAGAPVEDGGAGNPKPDAGAAYLFERDEGGAGNWGQVKKLSASDAQASDQFGYSVGLSGDAAVVGAPVEDGGPSNSLTSSGAAYLFMRNIGGVGAWGQADKLTASDAGGGEQTGFFVALSGDTALAGAPLEDAVPADPDFGGGAAYLFEFDAEAHLTIIKTVVGPLPDTAWQFTGSAGIGDFDLPAAGGSKVITELIPTTYTITETAKSGYTASVACTNGADGASNLQVTLNPGDVVNCTFTNKSITPTLTIEKVVVGGPLDADDFPLFVDGSPVTRGVPAELAVGTHTVSETSESTYTASFGGACNGNGQVTLALGAHPTCTITNTYVPPVVITQTLTVNKVVVGGPLDVDDFALMVDGSPVSRGVPKQLSAGQHTVSETGVSTYTAVFGGVCNANGKINLPAGAQVTCTITNTFVPTPTQTGAVEGLVYEDQNGNEQPDAGEGLEGVTVTLQSETGLAAALTLIDVTDDAGEYSFADVPAGSYTLSFAAPAGYREIDEARVTVVAGQMVTAPTLAAIPEGPGKSEKVYMPMLQR